MREALRGRRLGRVPLPAGIVSRAHLAADRAAGESGRSGRDMETFMEGHLPLAGGTIEGAARPRFENDAACGAAVLIR